jgi:hypothetical protein
VNSFKTKNEKTSYLKTKNEKRKTKNLEQLSFLIGG